MGNLLENEEKETDPDKLCGYGRWKPGPVSYFTGQLKESTSTAESP